MNAARRPLALLLSLALAGGPTLAQGDLDLPEGDFSFPEGDFSDPATEEESLPDQTDVEPPPSNAGSTPPPGTPSADDSVLDPPGGDPRARGADHAPEEHSSGGRAATGGDEAVTPTLEARPPRRSSGGRVEERLVSVAPAQPPAAEDNPTLTWVLTGVGATLGVAALAGLGVGGALLLAPNLGPRGSITVTPR